MRVTIEIQRPSWMTPTRLRRLRPLLVVAALVFAGPVLASDRFSDVPNSNVHHDNISLIADAGITLGCNAEGTQYCPDLVVTRDQMASFVARTAGLGANPPVTNADELDGLDAGAFQLRVNGTCAAGTAIRVVNADGTVACEADDVDGGDAETLDGLDSTEIGKFVTAMHDGNWTGSPPNDVRGCTVAAQWTECGAVDLTVPAGKTYVVTIEGTGAFFAFGEANRVQACTSVRPTTQTFDQATACANVPTGITLESGQVGSLSVNGTRTLSGGESGTTYRISTAVRPDAALHFFNGFDVTTLHTMVLVFEPPT